MDCSKALQGGPNAKALLRRGTARAVISDLDGAIQDFKHVLALEPSNRRVKNSLVREVRARPLPRLLSAVTCGSRCHCAAGKREWSFRISSTCRRVVWTRRVWATCSAVFPQALLVQTCRSSSHG